MNFANNTYFLITQVKYRMEGLKAKTTSLYDGEAREIAHVKHVSELISKVSACVKIDLWILINV